MDLTWLIVTAFVIAGRILIWYCNQTKITPEPERRLIAYGWSRFESPSFKGNAVPLVFGTVKSEFPVLSRCIRGTTLDGVPILWALVCIGEGRCEEVLGVWVDDVELTQRIPPGDLTAREVAEQFGLVRHYIFWPGLEYQRNVVGGYTVTEFVEKQVLEHCYCEFYIRDVDVNLNYIYGRDINFEEEGVKVGDYVVVLSGYEDQNEHWFKILDVEFDRLTVQGIGTSVTTFLIGERGHVFFNGILELESPADLDTTEIELYLRFKESQYFSQINMSLFFEAKGLDPETDWFPIPESFNKSWSIYETVLPGEEKVWTSAIIGFVSVIFGVYEYAMFPGFRGLFAARAKLNIGENGIGARFYIRWRQRHHYEVDYGAWSGWYEMRAIQLQEITLQPNTSAFAVYVREFTPAKEYVQFEVKCAVEPRENSSCEVIVIWWSQNFFRDKRLDESVKAVRISQYFTGGRYRLRITSELLPSEYQRNLNYRAHEKEGIQFPRVVLENVNWISGRLMSFPHTAMCEIFMEAPSEQSSSSKISLKVKGLLVPNLELEDPWSSPHWSDNPVEILLDVFSNYRYGLGEFFPKECFDLPSWRSAKQFCDQKGWTCNVIVRDRIGIQTFIEDLLLSFCGMIAVVPGKVKLLIDKEGEISVATLNNDDFLATDGQSTFKCYFEGGRKKYNRVVVKFRDEDHDYRQDSVIVDDDELIGDVGDVIATEVTCPTITKRSHAQEIANYILKNSTAEPRVCEFETSLKWINLSPGDVIRVDALGSEVYYRIVEMTETPDFKLKFFCREYKGEIFDISKLVLYEVPYEDTPTLRAGQDFRLPTEVDFNVRPLPEGTPGVEINLAQFLDKHISKVFAYFKELGGDWQFGGEVRGLHRIDGLEFGKTYEIKLLPVSRTGVALNKIRAPVKKVDLKAPLTIEPPRVAGLEVFGQRHTRVSWSKDFHFVWLRTSMRGGFGRYEAGTEPLGVGESVDEPSFKDFEVKIFNKEGVHVRTAYTEKPEFVYTEQMNIVDNVEFCDTITVEVRMRTQQNVLSRKAEIFTAEYKRLFVRQFEFEVEYQFDSVFGRPLRWLSPEGLYGG